MFNMNIKAALFILVMGLMVTIVGCDSEPTEVEDYDPEPVLFAYIETTKPFQMITLEWVNKDIGSVYIPYETGITGADVKIFPIADTNGVFDSTQMEHYTMTFTHGPTNGAEGRGHYYPDLTGTEIDTVRPTWTYRIEVTKGDEVDMWAETTVPDTFTVVCSNHQQLNDFWNIEPDDPQELPDSFMTFNREMDPFNFEWSLPWYNVDYGGDPVGGYVFNIVALTDTSELERLDPDWDPNDPDDAIEEDEMWRAGIGWSPDYFDYFNVLWIFFDWAGPHRLDIMACSVEYSRYVLSHFIGNPTSGEVTRPEKYMNGGLGCFGAITKHSVYIQMERVEN